jgi:GNAT superfamily N-acetyltransferase
MTVCVHAVSFSADESPLLASAARSLFQAYYSELSSRHGVHLAYQGVQEELDGLPGRFGFAARGGLWVASHVEDGEPDDEVVHVGPGALLPGGAKLTADSFVGVVALRPLAGEGDAAGDAAGEVAVGACDTCEVKRMFVTAAGRRRGIAYALSAALVRHAQGLGDYRCIKLDSLERLPGAVALYEKLGFARCEKYCECPEEDHVCMSMDIGEEPEATG